MAGHVYRAPPSCYSSSRYALGQLTKTENPPSPPFGHVGRRTYAVLSICVTMVLTGADQSGAFTNNGWIVVGDVRSRAGLRKDPNIDRSLRNTGCLLCVMQARRREEFWGPAIAAADSIVWCVLPVSLVLASSCLGQAPLASSLTRRKDSSRRWRRSRRTSTSSRIATKRKRRCEDGHMMCLAFYPPRSYCLPGAVAESPETYLTSSRCSCARVLVLGPKVGDRALPFVPQVSRKCSFPSVARSTRDKLRPAKYTLHVSLRDDSTEGGSIS